MAVLNVIMPKLGMYMEDVRLVEWLREEGDAVSAGDLLFTLETDKVTSDVEAEDAGFLHRMVPADSMVPIGTVVGAIAGSREELDALVRGEDTGAGGFQAAQSELFLDYIRESASDLTESTGAPQADPSAGDVAGRGSVSPRARALITRLGLSPEVVATIPATGPGGRLTDRDVHAYLDRRTEASRQGPRAVTVAERIPLRGRRGLIARRMMESLHTSAQLTSILEIDVSRVVTWRAQADPRPGYASIFTAIAARALRRHPIVNARVADDVIEVLTDVNVGVAVTTDDGVIVPVVVGADLLSLAELDAVVVDLTTRARAGKVTLGELDGATFTLSNSGNTPVDITTAIISPPQAAILWLGRIRDRPVAVDGSVAVRPTVQACLTYDHRVLDGVPAAAFLGTVDELCAAFPDFLEGR